MSLNVLGAPHIPATFSPCNQTCVNSSGYNEALICNGCGVVVP